jgi:hypothetical protein
MSASKFGLIEPGGMSQSLPFITSAVSGLLTATIGAASDLWSLRNASSNKVLSVTGVRMAWLSTTAFDAAQSLAFGVHKVTGFTAIHTGGAAIKTIATRPVDSIAPAVDTPDVQCRMAAAALIDTATYTAPDADEPDVVLATDNSVAPGGSLLMRAGSVSFPIFRLRPDEGLVLKNLVAFGSTGVGRLFVGIDWHSG